MSSWQILVPSISQVSAWCRSYVDGFNCWYDPHVKASGYCRDHTKCAGMWFTSHDMQALCGAPHRPFLTCRPFYTQRVLARRTFRIASVRRVWNGSVADIIYYLNRTILPVIGTESSRAQLSELTRPPHHQKWPRTGATSATRRAGVRCVKQEAWWNVQQSNTSHEIYKNLFYIA